MSAQNLLTVGFNVAELSAEAQEVLAIVEKLYAELKKYDGMKVSPISASGVTELVAAVKSQQTSMESLQTTIADLGLAMKTYNQVAAETAKINAKIAVSDSELGKANAAAKVQLQENTRALKEKAQAANQDFQLRKAIEEEEKQLRKDAVAAEKQAAKDKSDADKAYTKEYERLLKERDAAAKKADADQKKRDAEQAKQKVAAGKQAVKDSDLYNQLVNKRKDLETKYANALISKAPKAEQKDLAKQLQEANAAIKEVDKSLEKAGSSATGNLGRGLNSVFGSIRQIAYILPGLGIAGIFNLAFEAIMKCLEALDLFGRDIDKLIKYEAALAEITQKNVTIMGDLAEAFGEADKASVDAAKRRLALAQASGQNYAQQIDDIKLVQAAEQQAADNQVKYTHASYASAEQLNKRVIDLEREKQSAVGNTYILAEEFRKLDQTKANWHNFVDVAIYKAARGMKLGTEKETQDAYLKLLDQELASTKEKYKLQSDALNNQRDVQNGIQQKALEDSKYFSDEQLKIILDNAEFSVEMIKRRNQKILDNELSTRDQRLAATVAIQNEDEKLALAKYNSVVNKIGVTQSEVIAATNDYNQKLYDIDADSTNKRTKIIVDFYLKHLELVHQTKQTEILMEQLADKTAMDNEQGTYDKRMSALIEYTNDREQIIRNQYNKDVENARATTPADLLPDKLKQLYTEYKKQILDVENGTRKEAYDISQSWFNKQLKGIKEHADNSEEVTKNAATKELTDLNDKFEKGEISYRKFSKMRIYLEYETQRKINAAKIEDNNAEIQRLTALQDTAKGNLTGATFSYSLAFTQKGKDKAQGEIDAAKEQYNKLGKQINDINTENATIGLKDQEAINKLKEDAIKQTNANWMELEKEAIDAIQSMVDQSFEDRINKLQALTEAQDKATEAEIAAIEKSTLSAKEKNAYDVQLTAQKTARDEEAARKEKKMKHDQAVFDKEVGMAKIVMNTAIAVSGALTQVALIGPAATGLAISYAALGAGQLAIAAAQKIPEYAEGGTHTKDGLAIFGESGKELVKEPHKRPYIAERPTLAHLPAGTELFPLYDIPSFPERADNSWAQTMYLGRQIAKSKREIKNVFKPRITVDISSQLYVNRILHG